MKVILTLIISFLLSNNGCYGQSKAEGNIKDEIRKAKVTFVELGSINCIPCKQMQPVMKAIEEKYGNQIKIVFYDVWTNEGKPYASMYGINLIPTQVFLDINGNEFHRHQGFYPEKEIDKILQKKGLKPINKKG